MVDKVVLRKDMMNLWKCIFGDSDEYINLCFDTYFNSSLLEYRYLSEKLISQLMCVPYSFSTSPDSLFNGASVYNIRSGYLCGLATLPEYRGKGIMYDMINKCHRRLFNDRFALSVLIPASDSLRQYYNKLNYVDISFYNIEKYGQNNKYCGLKYKDITEVGYSKYINLNNNEYINLNNNEYIILDVNKYLCGNARVDSNRSDNNILKDIYCYVKSSLNTMFGAVINHTYDDFTAIFIENNLSGGHILYLKSINNKPLGLLCCSNIIEDEATVQLLIAESEESENILLETLKGLLPPDASITVRRYEDLESPTHSDTTAAPCGLIDSLVFPEGEIAGRGDAVTSVCRRNSFAMGRILNVAEVLKFAAALHPDSEFSILIKEDEFVENEGLYEVKDGSLSFSPIADMSEVDLVEAEHCCSSSIGWYELSVPELAAILWRPSSESTAEAAHTIPRVPLTIFLMLE